MRKSTGISIFVFILFVLIGYGALEYVKDILCMQLPMLTTFMLVLWGALIPYLIGKGKIYFIFAIISLMLLLVSIYIGAKNITDGKVLVVGDKDILTTAIVSLHIVIPLVAFICGVLEEREKEN